MTNFTHIVLTCVILMGTEYIRNMECCRFGPAPNCGFQCRCTGDNQCDSETGECAPGSQCQQSKPAGYGWQGPGCMIGNVAFNKSNVQQLGKYYLLTADLAVDGNTDPYIPRFDGNDSCAHPFTFSDTFAWWWVDLGGLYNIQTIVIANRLQMPGTSQPLARYKERSTDYDIKIGNTSSRSDHKLCFHQNKPGVDIQPVETIECTDGDIVGRFVSFTRTGGRDPWEAALCEFIVIGHEVIECDREYCMGNCDPVIGCEQCAAGKMLPDCGQDCPVGYWGVNCATECGKCKNGLICDSVTGLCGGQCEGWYLPKSCTLKLDPPIDITNLSVSNITSDSAVLVWNSTNTPAYDTYEYFFFTVRYRQKEPDQSKWDFSDDIVATDINGDIFVYIMSGLEYNTEYTVQVLSFRKLNGLTEGGTTLTREFTTICRAPMTPATPSIQGDPDIFTVTWENMYSSCCDSIFDIHLQIQCHNATHITDEIFTVSMAETSFKYTTRDAVICYVRLAVTNNDGLFSTSLPGTISLASFSDTETVSTLILKESNLGTLTAGTVGGVVCLALIIVIVALAVRLKSVQKNMISGHKDSASTGDTQQQATYENTNAFDHETDLQPGTEYLSVDNDVPQGMFVEKGKVGQSLCLYENSQTSDITGYERIQKDDFTDIDKTVYQELD